MTHNSTLTDTLSSPNSNKEDTNNQAVTDVTAHARTLVSARAMPVALRPYKQFVAWRYEDTGKPKPIKVPVNCNSPKLGNAGATWPNTWTTLLHAVETYQTHAHLAGVGFVLTDNDPYTMIDLDGCMLYGEPNPFACEVLNRLQTYAELSPSGKGLRLFVKDPSQPRVLKRPEIEIYSRERFATLTGNLLDDRPIASVDLTWLYEMFPQVEPAKDTDKTTGLLSERQPIPEDDRDLWDRIFHLDRFGPAHMARFNGDLSGDRGDPSLAVIRLLNCLARWTSGDAMRMERMIRQAQLDQSKFDHNRNGWHWINGRILDAINYTKGR